MSSQNLHADDESAELYELFEEALGLHTIGVSYESVLAKCPARLRDELRLQIGWATRLQSIAPAMARPRSQSERIRNRNAFLSQARTLGAANNKRPVAKPSLLDTIIAELQEFIQRLGQLSPQNSPRFAPIVAMIALLLISTVGVGSAAAMSLPGDAIYPVKEFVRDTRESLATGPVKEDIIEENENARRQDNQQAAVDRQKPITVTQELRFYQKGESIWDIGGQVVLPGYPTDPAGQPDVAMELHGDPQPGDQVRLTYMIMPGKPNMVYGVRLEVLSKEEIVVATPTPPSQTPVATVTSTPTSSFTYCEATPPVGWIVYRIQRGDTLSGLAVRTGVQYSLIKQVNCRTTDVLLLGSTIYLPAVPGVTIVSSDAVYVIATPTRVPQIAVTPLPTATELIVVDEPTPVVEATATTAVEIQPTEDGAGIPSEDEPTSTPTEEDATIVPTTEGGAIETPVVEETDTPVTIDTPAASETPAATETPIATEENILTSTPTVVQETPQGESTATVAAEPTVATVQPTATFPTVTPTPIPNEPTVVSAEPTIILSEPTVQVGGETDTQPTVEATLAVPTQSAGAGDIVDSAGDGDVPSPVATAVPTPVEDATPVVAPTSSAGEDAVGSDEATP